jgi:hypothetical protein
MRIKFSWICLSASLAVAAVAQTQTAPPPPPKQQDTGVVSQQAGDSELGLFTGAVIPPGGGAKIGGGANFAYAVNTWLYPYVEFSVLPGALNQQVTAGNSTFVTNGNLADFNGGLHIRFPINKRFVPYAVIAVGGFKPYSVTLTQMSGGNTINSQSVSQGLEFAVNYGGGIRYYITNRIGVRFEAKAYHSPSSAFSGTPVRVMGGIFFQFKKNNK